MAKAHHPVIIAGNGIAGLTAAIYAGRANNQPLVLKGDEPGGQLTLTNEVANFPGFPEALSGPQLIGRMEEQAEKFGATLQNGIVEDLERDEDGMFRAYITNGDVYTSDAFIAASGASARWLGVEGEDAYMGDGVSTCATCDGAFFRGEDMVVVGGGDAAFEETDFLTKFAETVYLVHRREGFRAEDYWIDRVQEHVDNGDVEILKNTEATEILGDGDKVTGVSLVEHPDGHPTEKLDDPEYDVNQYNLDVGAVFYAIGHDPNTEYLQGIDGVEIDEAGYLIAEGGRGSGQTKTGVSGLFGAGDVLDFHYQQAVTAAGIGCQAAMDADAYLSDE